MEPLIERFLDEIAPRRAAATVRAYGSDLRQLADVVAEVGAMLPTTELMRTALRRFGTTPVTRARKLASFRSFGAYLVRIGELAADPSLPLEAPYRRRPLPKGISEGEAERLLDGQEVGKTPARDHVILELLYSAGMRAAEVVSVRRLDVDLATGSARVRGKGAKERIVLFGAPCIRAIENWLAIRPQSDAPELILNADGRPLTTRTVQNVVKRWARVNGLSPQVSPHTLR
ncbi:MAG: hypothetical protein C4320_05770, partial [Armatimonadota bacterium]